MVGLVMHSTSGTAFRAHSGDEPHYLAIVHSLLFDGDLFLENNYENARNGGPDVGASFRGAYIDPHAYLVDYATGRSFKWHDLYDQSHRIDPPDDGHGIPFASLKPNPFQPGGHHLVPSHPPAFAAMVAALARPFDPAPEDVERLMGKILLGLAVLTLFVGYFTGLSAGLSQNESVAAVALFALCSPWLVYTKSYFTEGMTALFLLAALAAHLRGRQVVAGLFLVAAIWIKLPYALVGAAWLAWCVWQRRGRDALLLALVLGLGTMLLITFNYAVARVPLISGALPLRFFARPCEFVATLLSPQRGLLVFAPWVVLSLAALPLAWPREAKPAYASILLPLFPYYVLVSLVGFSSGCYGCRYWVPFLPWLAILAVFAARRGRAVRATLVALALVAMVFAVSATLAYGANLWNKPPIEALGMMFH